jgi:hypothetical protein
MKWVTRRKARVDRIACPWLIQRFIDPDAEFLFVPEDQVMDTARREGALPFDVPGVEPRYRRRARSRRGHMARQFPVYDALYAYCRTGHA